MIAITSFTGRYRFLSNFWSARVIYDRVIWPTVEHAYQAAKINDPEERVAISASMTANLAKRTGRCLTLRPGWESVKLDVMLGLLRQKFFILNPLADQLIATGDAELIEGNTWSDTYWGVCRGRGHNHLGRLLMQVRSEIQ